MSAFNKTLNNVIKNRTRSSSGGRRPSKSSSEVIISTQNTPTSSNQSNNNSQNFNESSDSTDYEENSQDSVKFRNNKVSANKNEIESNFKVLSHDKKNKKTIWNCNLCNIDVKTSSGSNSNLRSNLGLKHEMKHLLTKSQLERKENRSIVNEPIITNSERDLIHDKLVDSIIEDSRTFNDFLKSGIKKLFKLLKPGYKPPCYKTIMKLIKKK